jgi:hypothetical protein
LFKFACIFALFTLSFSSFGSADSGSGQIKQEVLDSFESLVSAAKKLDSDLYFQHFDAEKFVGLNSDGTNWNSINDLTPLIVNGFDAIETIDSLNFTNVKVSVIDSYTVILVNEYVQSMTLKNGSIINVSGGGSQVWSKRSGNWKIVSVSASSKPNASTPQERVI